jgi:hypothetical protein
MSNASRIIAGTVAVSLGLAGFGSFTGAQSATASPLPRSGGVTIPTGPIITVSGGRPSLVVASQDIGVTIENGVTGPIPIGTALIYTATVRNYSDNPVDGVGLIIANPEGVSRVVWVCSPSPGSTCGGSAEGGNAIYRSITLAGRGTTTFTISGRSNGDSPLIAYEARMVPPVGFGDINPANNIATDSDAAVTYPAETVPPTTTATVPAVPTPAPSTTAAPVPATVAVTVAVTVPPTVPVTVPATSPTTPPAPPTTLSAPAKAAGTTIATPQTAVIVVKTPATPRVPAAKRRVARKTVRTPRVQVRATKSNKASNKTNR